MIDALLADGGLRTAVDDVHPAGEHAETIARIAWSVLAEPGDGVAGALVGELGAAGALRFVFGDTQALVPPGDEGRTIREGIARWSARADPEAVRRAVTDARDVVAQLVVPGDPEWPIALEDLGAHAPIVLWVRGDTSLLSRDPRVAIVGARASSAYGEMVRRRSRATSQQRVR